MFAIKTQAMNDTKSMSQQGVNILDMSKELGSLIRLAEDKASKSHAKEVTVEGLTVKISEGILGGVECPICQYRTNPSIRGSKLYVISNDSGLKMTVYGHIVHQIESHHYFGQGMQRLDPELVLLILAK